MRRSTCRDSCRLNFTCNLGARKRQPSEGGSRSSDPPFRLAAPVSGHSYTRTRNPGHRGRLVHGLYARETPIANPDIISDQSTPGVACAGPVGNVVTMGIG